jgi:hypothetical protein
MDLASTAIVKREVKRRETIFDEQNREFDFTGRSLNLRTLVPGGMGEPE